ncbi:MAG: hypothetical protein IPN40_09590 [Uliginosibacterium sp.]|nr:hypothetical protein [Uliginosibacterium sp.]
MIPAQPSDDPLLNDQLLSKADALIRRNRPGGVGTDAEEIPLLVDAIDDLPELTDEVSLTAVPSPLPRPANDPEQDFVTTQLNPVGLQRPEPEPPPAPNQAVLIREAVERSRRELMNEMLVEQERAVQEAVERVRGETKALHSRAVQAAYAQGKEEAEINYWPALQEARKEAIQHAAMSMSEHLITLDSYISQSIEGWLAKELPQIISTEMEAFITRLRQQTTNHMRATLIPDISEKLSSILDEALKEDPGE